MMESGKVNNQILLAPPTNQGKIGSGQYHNKNTARSRSSSHGANSGLLKQGQEYRPKAVVTGKTPISPESKDVGLQVLAKSEGAECGSGVRQERAPSPVGVLTRLEGDGMVSEVGSAGQCSGLVPMNTSTSLEESNHTVMILKQSREALDSLTNLISEPTVPQTSRAGVVGERRRDKENKAYSAAHGIQLQTSTKRNLRVKKKASGMQISKDAFESMLARDWRVSIIHVFREGNRCADFLATFALNLEEGFHALEFPPEGMHRLLHDDEVGVGSTRMCPVVSD
ncbi:hypothetical protein K1719_023884 [Acacia pycnantha]|nr:hypothetical protein K1719_023884 [Acacia pycnantha]